MHRHRVNGTQNITHRHGFTPVSYRTGVVPVSCKRGLSAEEEVEELELELHSRLLMLCKEHLIELFDKFEIFKETLQNNT